MSRAVPALVLLIAVLAAAGGVRSESPPSVSEEILVRALGASEAARARLFEAERRLEQARAEARQEAEAAEARLRAETASLSAHLAALQAAPDRAAGPLPAEPPRLRDIARLLAEHETRVAVLQERAGVAEEEARRAEQKAELAGAAAARGSAAVLEARETEARGTEERDRLRAPSALEDRDLRELALREIPPTVIREESERLERELDAFLPSVASQPAERDARDRFSIREIRAGRWWFAGLQDPQRGLRDIWELQVTRDGLYVLGQPMDVDISRFTPPPANDRQTGAYDTCLLENMRGVASETAAAAILSACRARHPQEARFNILVELPRRLSGGAMYLLPLNAEEMRGLIAVLAASDGRIEPYRRDAARRLNEIRIAEADRRLSEARDSRRAAEQKAVEAREADSMEQAAADRARAAAVAAQTLVEEALAAPAALALVQEAVALRAEWERRKLRITAVIEAERQRLAGDVAAAEAELRDAQSRQRALDEPRRMQLAEAEANAVVAVALARQAVAAAANEIPVLRRALAERWRDEYLRERVRVGLTIRTLYGDNASFCVSVDNTGDLVLIEPRLSVRFRGRTLEEQGLPTEWLASLRRPTFTYMNRYQESVSGLLPGSGWGYGHNRYEAGCVVMPSRQARIGDTARNWERAGGYTIDREAWSVSLSADLGRREEIRELASGTWDSTNSRRWTHVQAPPEQLFFERLNAVRPVELGGNSSASPPAPTPAAQTAVPAPSWDLAWFGFVPTPAPRATEPAPPVSPSAAQSSVPLSTGEVQRRLREAGLYRGALDGVMGPGTRAAIRAFERQRGLPETGESTGATAQALRSLP